MSQFGAEFFQGNRRAVGRELQGGVLVLSAYERMQQKSDMTGEFRQEANFWYICGITQPGWKVVYDVHRDKTWLIKPELSDIEIIFNGDVDDTMLLQQSGADEIVPARELDALLRRLAKTHSSVYTVKPEPQRGMEYVPNPAAKRLVRCLERSFASVLDARKSLARLRAIKQPQEVNAIKTAIATTISAFEKIMERRANYGYEYEIEADAWHVFRSKNAKHAYEPIIAGGLRATTLHYTANAHKLAKKNCVLLDIGATCGEYNADITRTISLHEPSTRQSTIHAVLSSAHKQIISLIAPGVGIRDYLAQVDGIMKQALFECGLLPDGDNESLYRTYFPHAISHGLGIDVHDSLGGLTEFQPGMVLTVEPGIYVPKESIGMRVEDDILVTERGNENLSKRLTLALNECPTNDNVVY